MTAPPGRNALRDLLLLLLKAIERVNEDIDPISKATFLADTIQARRIRDAVVLNLGTMGEVARDIRSRCPDFASERPDIPLGRIWDMRCHLFHGYHAINYDVVWTTCRSAVPELERQVRDALAHLPPT